MNTALLCDFYGLTMAQQAMQCGMGEQIGWFELFFRRIPDGGGYALAAGLEPILQELEALRFTAADIAFLRKHAVFSPEFLTELQHFRFTGDIYAVPEGTPVFSREPLLTLRAALPAAYLLETRLIQQLGYATLIATKASRMVYAASGRLVWELGARRAHSADAAIAGARAAYLAGCAGSSCTAAQLKYDIPVTGTMSHAWIQQFPTEYEAFAVWCKQASGRVVLLTDTYNTLKSGVPNAIRAIREILLPRGITDFAVRLDSGNLSELSRAVRRMLDDAGLQTCRIFVSNALDEFQIQKLVKQHAPIDAFGAGERLITAKSEPILGCVLKLTALERPDGTLIPKWKKSESKGKSTLPYPKQIWRGTDPQTGVFNGDWICRMEEFPQQLDSNAIPLLKHVMKGGQRIAKPLSIAEIRTAALQQTARLPEENRRLTEPEPYPLHFSDSLTAYRRTAPEQQKSQTSGM